MSAIALGGKDALESRWPDAALAAHTTMVALFASAEAGGTVVEL